jgi:hypothetical protein
MLCLWAFFVMFGYMIPLLSVATYSTAGIGLSQAQGASIQAILAAGQLVGRPSLGLMLDHFGTCSFYHGYFCHSAHNLHNFRSSRTHQYGFCCHVLSRCNLSLYLDVRQVIRSDDLLRICKRMSLSLPLQTPKLNLELHREWRAEYSSQLLDHSSPR